MLGRSLGNYHVVSKIAEDGIRVVYLARHVTLGRPAAVKVLHPSLSSNQDMVTRFFNEARAATAVRSPGIVEVFDFGILEDKSAYIVMEYLEGENLGMRIRRGRLSVGATMTIVRAIARALQAAHEQGIVHRDLKPDNVFLVPDQDLPSGERVKLLDFGIAKLAPEAGETSHTRTGVVMGTPTYMAPEQCRGAGSVDHRADLYALGCVAYQMMSGQPPFVSDGAGDMIARHLYFQPQPLRALRPEIPADVDDLVLWLLQKEPGARPATAADLVRAIDELATVSEGGAMRTQPPHRFSAPNFAPVVETTLGGAASTMAVVTRTASRTAPPRPRRAPLIAGVAGGVIAVAVMLVVVLRGGRDDEAATARAAASPPAAPAAPAPASAAPTSAAPTAPAPTPSAVATPSAPVPPAVPAAASPPPASPPPAVVSAPPATSNVAEHAERTARGNHKKHPAGARVAQRDAEPAAAEPAATAAPAAPTPPAAPPQAAPPQVAQPPAAQPPPIATPPAEPAHVAVKPPAAPVATAAKAPPMISATAVSKRSGAIPAIKVNGIVGDFADVIVKLCIDDQGAVSSAKIIKAPPEIGSELQRSLQSWRYTPYINPAGAQSAACFPVSFRVILKS